jgi:lysozyme
MWMPNSPRLANYPVRGLDVSAHQGRVNWRSVAKSGIRFVYLKATEGGDFRDQRLIENLRDARAAGLTCGAYHFFSLRSPGVVQAQNFIGAVPKGSVTVPPAVDLEFAGNSAARPSAEEFQKQFGLFLNAIRKNYGCEPVIYASDDFSSVYLKGYSIQRPWVRAVIFGPNGDGNDSWVFWQFTDRARVPGIHGFVDMDVFNGNSAEFDLLTEGKRW